MFRRCVLLTSLVCAICAAQSAEKQTTVTPLPQENILRPCDYQLVLPEGNAAVKAVWIIFDRGQDYLKWFQDRQVRAFARQHDLALVLAMQCRSKEREDMIVDPNQGVGRTMFTALDQFAVSENHPELKTTSIIAMGWSGAGSLVARLAGYRSDRYLAGIAYAPGQYDPLGMETIQLPIQAIRSPQLIIANGGDNINGTNRPYAYFKKYFDQGAPWTFVIQNHVPHCCLQNAQILILDWLHGVLTTTPDDHGTGDYGYLTVQFSDIADTWKKPVFNAVASRVGTKGEANAGWIPAGWMPSSTFSEEWLTFTKRSTPVAIWKP